MVIRGPVGVGRQLGAERSQRLESVLPVRPGLSAFPDSLHVTGWGTHQV